jgi:hypothetical protein
MSVGVVLAGAVVVVVVGVRIEGRQLFEPDAEVVVQAALVVVDEHRRGDVLVLTRHSPSCTPLRRTQSATCPVMFTKVIFPGTFMTR